MSPLWCHCGAVELCRNLRCHNPRCMFYAPVERCNRAETLDRDEILARWPRLVNALQWVAVLSQTEAACALRDLHRFPKHGGSEAVAHFGGPLRCVREAIRVRNTVRKLYPMRHCLQCATLTNARTQLCSHGCAEAWFDGPGSRRPAFGAA